MYIQQPERKDADGNRISFTSSEGGTWDFVYDTTAGIPAVIEEYDGSASVYYVREPDGSLIARVDGEEFAHAFVADVISNKFTLSSKSSNVAYHFPLYIYLEMQAGKLFTKETGHTQQKRKVNLNIATVGNWITASGLTLVLDGYGDKSTSAGPEDIFHYVYGVLSSPGYRMRYADLLKIDFPRIPLTSDKSLFAGLCRLGEELVDLHLMEKHAPLITTYRGRGDNSVGNVRYTEPGQGSPHGRVWINSTQYFEGVPPEVWEFHIGGYQVCEKWLKDRGPKGGKPGRKLSDEDILHYQRVIAALKETIRIMGEIDAVIEAHGGWPLPGSVPAKDT